MMNRTNKKPLVHIKNYKYILTNMKTKDVLFMCQYYTVICLCLQIFYYINLIYLNTYTLLSMIITCSTGGIYLTYINPKKLYLEATEFDPYVDGYLMKIFDVIMHHIPLILYVYLDFDQLCKKENQFNLYEIVGIPILYRILFNPYKIYKLTFFY